MLTNRKLMGCHGPQLGDVWAAVNYAILNNCDLSRYVHRTHVIEKKIIEVQQLLKGGESIKIRNNVAKSCFNDGFLWKTPYVDTKIQWQKKNYGRICYQFDGRTFGKVKNLSKDDENLFFSQNYNAERLGGNHSLEECVEIAATSDVFVGVCSGMSHLRHSVGIPVYLVGHKRLHRYHPGKKYTYCKDIPEFISKYSGNAYTLNKITKRNQQKPF